MKRGRRKRGDTQSPEPAAAAADKPGLAARMAAASLLAAVVDRHVPLDGLTDRTGGNARYLALDERDRLLVRAILSTALRFRGTIEALVAARLERPLPAGAGMLRHILHVAAAQMLFLDVPDSAAVDLAVTHAGADPRTRRFSGLVNGVLREIGRRKERALPAALAATIDAPQWFVERLSAAYGPEGAAAMLGAHRTEPGLDLTVRSDPEGWAARLGGFVLPTGSVRLPRPPVPVPELPGFAEGAWWVQDAAAALPARLMGEIAGLRVADLCAAPGGKTAQLCLAGAEVTAVEKSPARAARLRDNLDRLGMAAEVLVTDLFDLAPERPFDAVLLDAPCSATGTARRHPDVLWTRRAEDIDKLAALQRRMLAKAVELTAPGGRIVFANCSLDPAEGEELVDTFLATGADAAADPLRPGELAGADGFVDQAGRLRTTPGAWPDEDPARAGLDGFFAARLRRFG